MEGDGKLAQAHIVFKDAGSRGKILFGALLGVEGRGWGAATRPAAVDHWRQELWGPVICAASRTELPLALL